jgi:hypothetical protein
VFPGSRKALAIPRYVFDEARMSTCPKPIWNANNITVRNFSANAIPCFSEDPAWYVKIELMKKGFRQVISELLCQDDESMVFVGFRLRRSFALFWVHESSALLRQMCTLFIKDNEKFVGNTKKFRSFEPSIFDQNLLFEFRLKWRRSHPLRFLHRVVLQTRFIVRVAIIGIRRSLYTEML